MAASQCSRQRYSDDGHESLAEYAEDSIRNTVDEVIYDTGHEIRQAIKGAVRKDGFSPADEHKPTGETVDSEVMPSPQQPYSAQRQAIMRNEQKTSVSHRKEQQREMIISESVANTQMDNGTAKTAARIAKKSMTVSFTRLSR